MSNLIWQANKKINELDFMCNDDIHEMLVDIIRSQQAIIEELAARLTRLEVFTGMTAPVPSLPVARIAAQQASDAEFDAALAMRARDDHDEMATWLTEQIGESVQHHPIENLRIFMERQIHNLEAGL